MGASFSTRLSESNMELRKRVDAAATKIIMDSNFTDLTNLANVKYCNRLVKKAANIFQQNKDTVDIELLQRTLYTQKQKDETHVEGEKTSEKHDKKVKTPKIQNLEKKCIQISKFYVLFAHLFSCIISTINPSSSYSSSSSKKKEKTTTDSSSKEDKESSNSTSESKSSSFDFCSSRIDALVNGELIENSDGDILVKPNVCKTNVSKSGSPLHLVDLPGMKALQQLYKDVNDGNDSEMEDAQYLYKAFTGKKDAPENIRRLDQVPLKVYNKDQECKESKSAYYGGETTEEAEKREQRRDKERREVEKERMFYYYNERDRDRKKNEEENARTGVYLKGVVGSLKERLFSEYVQHIKEMIERAESNRSKLLEILSEMFTYAYDSGGNIENVMINPSLTYKKLQSLIVQTRRIVIKLYTDCEEDYKIGLDLFFAMVQDKIAMKLSVQEEVLKKQLEDVMYGPPERYIPESLLYQQQYQGSDEFSKKQFIPPHFKSSVVSIVKKELHDTATFQYFLPLLNEWINEEIENASGLLDPKQVADEFIRENVYGDAYMNMNDDNEDEDDHGTLSKSPAIAAASSPPPPVPAAMTPFKSSTSKVATGSKVATDSKVATGPGPVISPSPRKVKLSSRSLAVEPTKLSFIPE
jgi:hypothetical protein